MYLVDHRVLAIERDLVSNGTGMPGRSARIFPSVAGLSEAGGRPFRSHRPWSHRRSCLRKIRRPFKTWSIGGAVSRSSPLPVPETGDVVSSDATTRTCWLSHRPPRMQSGTGNRLAETPPSLARLWGRSSDRFSPPLVLHPRKGHEVGCHDRLEIFSGFFICRGGQELGRKLAQVCAMRSRNCKPAPF